VWRTERGDEHVTIDTLRGLSARRVVPGGSWWLAGGLLFATIAVWAGLPAMASIGALWLAAGARGLRMGSRCAITWTQADDPERHHTVVATGAGVLRDAAALRTELTDPGPASLDETWTQQLSLLLHGPSTTHRALGAWMVMWLSTAPIWLVMWAVALGSALKQGSPVGGTFVILAVGPPLVVLLWPLPVLFGLLLQAPFTVAFAWAARPPDP
jgi:hypothetical protein